MSLGTNEQLAMLMDINQLSYSPPIDGSLSNYRQGKKLLFNPSTYTPSQVAQLQINSGSDFISGATSYILLTCSVSATLAGEQTVGWNFPHVDGEYDGNGSAFNLFREFQISHRSGEVIDRTDQLNALVATLVEYAFDDSYRSQVAEVFGFANGDNLNGAPARTYALPLFLCSGLFAQMALIPSFLIAGARINIQLETPTTALCTNGTNPSYSITDMNLVLDSVDIYDAAKRSLLSQASNTSTQGLQFPYHSYFQLRKIVDGSSLNFDLNLSAAKTIQAIIKTRVTARINALGSNSIASEGWQYSTWRFRLGSLTMPQYEVNNPADSFLLSQVAFDGSPNLDLLNPKHVQNGVSYLDYATPDAGLADNGGNCVVAMTLEKQPILSLSGCVTNNSQLLNFTATYSTEVNRTVDAYIKHLRVANVMLDNVVIDR